MIGPSPLGKMLLVMWKHRR